MAEKKTIFRSHYPWLPMASALVKPLMLTLPKPSKQWVAKFISDWHIYHEHVEQKWISRFSLRRRLLKHLCPEGVSFYIK